MKFDLLHKDPLSKAGQGITTDHGVIETPIFYASWDCSLSKGVHQRELKMISIRYYFRNTYHLYLRPKLKS
jgi:queuine tRNA-ribosyltransferase